MMNDRAVAALLILGLASAGVAPGYAAESTAVPQMNTGHTTSPSPKTPAVSANANQIEATNVIGANVEDAKGTIIAKISDLAIDRHSGAPIAVLASLGGQAFPNGKSAVAWSSLRFEPQPTPHFVTRLGSQALAAGSASVEKAKDVSAYYDVKNDLLGKAVIGADGASLGHVHDLVLTLTTGHPVALVVETGGLISIGAKDHAVAWDAAKPQIGGNGAPVHIALSKAQVDQAPVTTTMAPAPIAPKPGNNQVQIRRDATGNISGSWVPAPANNR